MMSSTHILDGALLSYQQNFFILPTRVIAEIILVDFEYNVLSPWVGEYVWKTLPLPIITCDLLPCSVPLYRPKIAIVQALFSQKNDLPPFFAILFEDIPERIKIHSENIEWSDASQKKAKIRLPDTELTVTLLDLPTLSDAVAQIIRDPHTTLAKYS